MALTVTHKFVSAIPDDPVAALAGEVVPSNWNDTHTITGTQPLAYGTFSATGSTTGLEELVEITSGTFTLTLTSPTVAAAQAWKTMFKNSGAGSVTLSGTIDGISSFVLAAGSSVTLLFNGTGWLIF